MTTTEKNLSQSVLDLHQQGKSNRGIAAQLGVNHVVVNSILKAVRELDLGEGTDVKIVPFEQILDNPWNTRQTLDQDRIVRLAANIEQNSLLQTPKGRPAPVHGEGVVQLAFGHRRVAAIKLLAAEGKWPLDGVPIVLEDLTDEKMFRYAMAENDDREDVNNLERYEAAAKALETIPDLTIQAVADSMKIDRSTLSNNLRVLRLPEAVRELIRERSMSMRAARELLCFVKDDHTHLDDIAHVLSRIRNVASGLPDWSPSNVRRVIAHRVLENDEIWRPLEKPSRHMEGVGGNAGRSPSFQAQSFIMQNPEKVHHIPKENAATAAWTCDKRAWQREQTKATREANQGREESSDLQTTVQPKPQSGSAVPLDDPLVRSVLLNDAVSVETVRSDLTRKILDSKPPEGDDKAAAYHKLNQHVARFLEHHTDKGAIQNLIDDANGVATALKLNRVLETDGSASEARGVVFNAVQNYQERVKSQVEAKLPKKPTKEQLEALGTRAEVRTGRQGVPFFRNLDPNAYDGVPEIIRDLNECRTRCNWGAAYVRPYQGARPELGCTNIECFNRKLDEGRVQFEATLQQVLLAEHDRAMSIIERESDGLSMAMADMIVETILDRRSVWKTLDRRMPQGARNCREYAYYPDYLQECLEPFLEVDGDSPIKEKELAEALRAKSREKYGADYVKAVAALIVYGTGRDREEATSDA